MNTNAPKTLKENARISFSAKAVIGLSFVLICLAIAMVGYDHPGKQTVTTKGEEIFKLTSMPMAGPTFYLVDSTGTTIDTKNGIKANEFHAMKVMAGSGFRVRDMEIIVSKGSIRMFTIMATTNDIPVFPMKKGDRVSVIIKRVLKATPNGEKEVAFTDGIIKIPVL